MLLDIPSAARVFYANSTQHNEKRRAGDPFLFVCDLGDLLDQIAVCDHAKGPGLFIPAGRGKPRSFEHFLDHIFRDRFVLEPADADASF